VVTQDARRTEACARAAAGAPHVVAQVQASKPSASGSGADGAPITFPFESISCISSEAASFAG
jgi:hypothetical protein